LSRPSFSKNTIIYLVGGVVAAGGNILLAPMYLRLLSAEDYGAWSQFTLMLQFLQPIMCWGLLATMARLLVDSDEEARTRKMAAALKMVTVLNAVLLLMIVGVTQQRFLQPLVADQLLDLLPFAAVAAALAAYPNILLGVYVADSKALQYRSLSLVGFILQAAFLGACASLFLLDVRMAILAMIAAASVYGALSVYQLARVAKWNADVYEYKELFKFGAPLVLYTIAGQSTDFVTRYVLSATVTATDFGAFSAGMIYASVVAMLASAINLAWVPLFYRRAQEWTASGFYQQVVDVIATITAVCGMFLIVFSDELLAIYSDGKVSLDGSTVGAIVISAWLSSAVWMGLSNPLFHQKRTKLVFSIVLLAIAICMPLALFLISRYGVFGASIALLFNALALCVIAALALYKLRMPRLNLSKIVILLILLILISSPLMNYLHHESSGLQRLAEKTLIFAAFAAVTLIAVFRSARNLLLVIESDGAR
jgi:O-antigen/teichoic acid export membrane protein